MPDEISGKTFGYCSLRRNMSESVYVYVCACVCFGICVCVYLKLIGDADIPGLDALVISVQIRYTFY